LTFVKGGKAKGREKHSDHIADSSWTITEFEEGIWVAGVGRRGESEIREGESGRVLASNLAKMGRGKYRKKRRHYEDDSGVTLLEIDKSRKISRLRKKKNTRSGSGRRGRRKKTKSEK